MKSILYIGNHLSQAGAYPSVAETLAPYLLPEISLRLVSRKHNKFLRLTEMLSSIFLYGRKENPIVIDVYSTMNFYYALISSLTCQILKIPYYCVLHGGNLPLRLKRNPGLCKMLFGKADKLIAPSEYLRNAFRENGYEVLTIPNPIPLENYSFKERKFVKPKLLWVRAFDKSYNPFMAVRVLQKLKEVYPDTRLCMVGPDKDGSRAECEQLSKELDVFDSIRFTGQLSKKDWIKLSEEFDIFINTTNVDNTPVSVIEAMAPGLPVVSTNVGGLPYLISDSKTGFLVEKGNIKAMATVICKLVENSNLVSEMTQNARKLVEMFDVPIIVDRWQKVLLYD